MRRRRGFARGERGQNDAVTIGEQSGNDRSGGIGTYGRDGTLRATDELPDGPKLQRRRLRARQNSP